MTSYAELHKAYNDLYVEVRKYFWGFPAVEALANLEIATYKACPDVDEVRRRFNQFCVYLNEIRQEDEDLDDAVTAFQELLDDTDETFMKLNKVNEVVQQ